MNPQKPKEFDVKFMPFDGKGFCCSCGSTNIALNDAPDPLSERGLEAKKAHLVPGPWPGTMVKTYVKPATELEKGYLGDIRQSMEDAHCYEGKCPGCGAKRSGTFEDEEHQAWCRVPRDVAKLQAELDAEYRKWVGRYASRDDQATGL